MRCGTGSGCAVLAADPVPTLGLGETRNKSIKEYFGGGPGPGSQLSSRHREARRFVLLSVAMSPLYCLYGSMTGKAQSIAEQIVQQGLSKGFEVIVLFSGTVTILNGSI